VQLMSTKRPTFSVLSQSKIGREEPEGEEPEGEEPEGEEPEGEEPEGEEPEGEEPEGVTQGQSSTHTTTLVVTSPEQPNQQDVIKPSSRARSRDLGPLPPPASAKEKQLRELNESIRVNIAKKIIKNYGGVTKELLQASSVASETLVATQASMNTLLSSQETLKKITTILSAIPLPVV